jgi:hypothetical protein
MDEAMWDGNAVGGDLGEIFAVEMTLAVTICATCGANRRVGELRAYLRAPGIVLRCAACGAPQVRLVRGPERAWLDLSGVRMLEVQLPAIGGSPPSG